MSTTCTGLEKRGSKCVAPEQDPILFELSKGSNPRYYQYAETKLRTDRVRERQNYMRNRRRRIEVLHRGDAAVPLRPAHVQC